MIILVMKIVVYYFISSFLQITDQLEACAWEYCRSCGHEPESVSDLAAHKDKYDGVYDAILSVVEM